MIYFDNAGTTKLSKKAKRAMDSAFKIYGNPSSLYSIGKIANKKLQEARESIAFSLQCLPEEIYFTSGGTESDNWAINSACEWGRSKGRMEIITTPIEHHAILNTLKEKEKEGFIIKYLPVYENGVVHLTDLKKMVTKNTCLVTIMYANNEIGTLQPIKEMATYCASKRLIFHTDAVQAVGHEEIDLATLGVDMMSASAHKFHGPKGIGFLYCRRDCPLTPFINGGAQEKGKRAGTENVAGAVGMAVALKESLKRRVGKNNKLRAIRDYLIKELSFLPNTRINGDVYTRLAGNVNVCFKDIDGATLQLLLDNYKVCVSNGSACTSGSMDPSHVLKAINVLEDYIQGNMRITLDESNTMSEAKRFIKILKEVLKILKEPLTNTSKNDKVKSRKVKVEDKVYGNRKAIKNDLLAMNGKILAYSIVKNGKYYGGQKDGKNIWLNGTGFIFGSEKGAKEERDKVAPDAQIITVFINEQSENL